MIRLDRVAKSRGGRPVLAAVDLKLERGQAIGLIGPSGSGKSTLLDIMAGMLRPDRGQRRMASGRLGYALQDDTFLPWRTCLENMLFVMTGTGRPEAERRAWGWLERLGLGELASRLPGELSGGQRRRLNLARSLVVEPDLLLWDEPYAFLDAAWRNEVATIALEVLRASGPALVVAGHDAATPLPPGWPVLEIARVPVTLQWGC